MNFPLHDHQEGGGTVWGEVANHPVARHYGDSAAEYRAVREGVGIGHRADLAPIRFWGRDPVRMLQGLITNDLAGAPLEKGVYAAMLTPKGRTLADLRAFRSEGAEGSEAMLLLPREALNGVQEHLKRFVPPIFARWAEASPEWGIVGTYGPRARTLLKQILDVELRGLAEDGLVACEWRGGRVRVIRTLYAGGEDGYDVVASAALLPELWDALLAGEITPPPRPVGFGALETLRIEAGRPRYGMDITEDTIATEAFESTGLLPRAISFTKGCYTGQEVIVRIAHRGHVNRHLRGLLLGDAPAPSFRTPLLHPDSGKEIGWTTSAAFSPQLGQTIALGYLRREVGPGDAVRLGAVGGLAATIAELPFHSPNLR